MRAPILDQPLTTVPRGDVEKVYRYLGDDRPIWTVDIVQSKERVDDGEIGLDEANAVVRERRLRGGGNSLRLGTEIFHHGDVPLQKITNRRHEGSILGE